MKGFLTVSLLCLAALAGASWGIVELLTSQWGAEYRAPLLWGCAGGLLVNLAAFPCMLKLATLEKKQVRDGAGLKWWLAGFLVRVAVLTPVYFLLRQTGDLRRAASYAMFAVYFAGVLIELTWFVKRSAAMDVN